MASNRSKIKGSNGERELAKFLSITFEASFVRSDNSGAFIGGKNIVRKAILSDTQQRMRKGDIIPPDHMPRLVIEAKSYKEFRFHQLLQPGPCPLLDEWIEQTMMVLDPGDQWFVAFKVSMLGWYLAIPEAECRDYTFENHCAYTGTHGAFRVTALPEFLRQNREILLKKAGPENNGLTK